MEHLPFCEGQPKRDCERQATQPSPRPFAGDQTADRSESILPEKLAEHILRPDLAVRNPRRLPRVGREEKVSPSDVDKLPTLDFAEAGILSLLHNLAHDRRVHGRPGGLAMKAASNRDDASQPGPMCLHTPIISAPSNT